MSNTSNFTLCREMIEAAQTLVELRKQAILEGRPLPWKSPGWKWKYQPPPMTGKEKAVALAGLGLSTPEISKLLELKSSYVSTVVSDARRDGLLPPVEQKQKPPGSGAKGV